MILKISLYSENNIKLFKENKSLRRAYDEGVEDGGFFGNGKDLR